MNFTIDLPDWLVSKTTLIIGGSILGVCLYIFISSLIFPIVYNFLQAENPRDDDYGSAMFFAVAWPIAFPVALICVGINIIIDFGNAVGNRIYKRRNKSDS